MELHTQKVSGHPEEGNQIMMIGNVPQVDGE